MPDPAACTSIWAVSTRIALGRTLAAAFGCASAGFGAVILLSVAAGSASAQTPPVVAFVYDSSTTVLAPTVPPIIVPPNSALPAPAPSVLGIVVETTTTAAPTTTKLPVPAIVLGSSITTSTKLKTEVLGEVLTSPAFTGSNSVPTALAGLGLFAAGLVLVVGARRRRPTTA